MDSAEKEETLNGEDQQGTEKKNDEVDENNNKSDNEENGSVSGGEEEGNGEQKETSPSKRARQEPSQQQQQHEVIDLLDSSSNGSDNDDDDASGPSGYSDPEWDDEEWEGPANEVPTRKMYAVIRACPHGNTESGHSSQHVKVLAVFRSNRKAEKRAQGIRARLDLGGDGDGMVPGGTGHEDEVEVWVQKVNTFDH